MPVREENVLPSEISDTTIHSKDRKITLHPALVNEAPWVLFLDPLFGDTPSSIRLKPADAVDNRSIPACTRVAAYLFRKRHRCQA